MNDKGMRMKYFGMIALLLLLSGCAGNENAFLHILHDMKKSPHCTIVSHVPYDMQHIKHLSSEERSIFLGRLEALFTQYPIQLSKEEIPPPQSHSQRTGLHRRQRWQRFHLCGPE